MPFQWYLPESESNSAIGVRTRLLRLPQSIALTITPRGPPTTTTGGLGSRQTNRDYPNDSIIENGQNTEESPENLKNHQLTLM